MTNDRPAGVTAIVLLCIITALMSLTYTLLIGTARIPLSSGAFVLSGGLEQLGPLAFLLYAVALLLLALALWRRLRFARQAAVLLAVVGIALAVPAISSAVTDSRLFAIAREGTQIVVRMVIVFYLTQEPVKDWFVHSAE